MPELRLRLTARLSFELLLWTHIGYVCDMSIAYGQMTNVDRYSTTFVS